MQSLGTSPGGVPIYDAHPGRRGMVVPPIPINAYSALTIPAYRRAVTFMAETLATLPRSVRKDGAKVDDGHPLDALMRREPNGYQTATDLWEPFFFHAVHRGNGYLRIDRGPGQYPVSLHTLLPEEVRPWRVRHAGGEVRQWYVWTPRRRPDDPYPPEPMLLPAADVLHLKSLSHDGMTGTDPVALHASTFQRAATLDRYMTRFLQSGSVVRGAALFKKPLDDEQMAQVRAELRRFQGSEAEDDILILSDEASLTNVTLTPKDSELAEQAAGLTKEFAQIVNVPPALIFDMTDTRYNGQSIEQQGLNVVRYSLRPWIIRAEGEMTSKLLTWGEQDAGYTIRLNPDALLRGDSKTQTETLVAQVKARVRTPNEARDPLGLPHLDDPEADRLAALGDASAPPAGAAASAAGGEGKTGGGAAAYAGDAYSLFAPVVAAACGRVESKTARLLEEYARRTDQERVPWLNAQAEGQGRYAADALKPVAEALAATGPDAAGRLGLETLPDRYAAAVRRRAATGAGPTLRELLP